MSYKLHFPFKSLQKYKLLIVRKLPYINFTKMKKIIGIIGVVVFAMTLFMNAAVLTNDSNEPEFKTTSFTTIAFANENEGEACSDPSTFNQGKFITVENLCQDSNGEYCGIERDCLPVNYGNNVSCTSLVCFN